MVAIAAGDEIWGSKSGRGAAVRSTFRDRPVQLPRFRCRSASAALLGLLGFLAYLVIRYGPVISRIFEMRPVFLPLQVDPGDTGEAVDFTTEDGLRLPGSYLARRIPERVGLLVFCHEYLSDRWSYLPYLDHLRDIGYDIFTFDFRNHGSSAVDPGYAPLQWATDHEVRRPPGRPAPICEPARIMIRRGSASSASAGGDPRRWSRPPRRPTSGAW